MAALLPISFLWLFVACILICGSEIAEHHAADTISLSMVMTDTPACAGCPVSSIPKATVQESARFDLLAPLVLSHSILAVSSLADSVAFPSHYHQSSFADPPLKRLPLLRI